MPTPRINLLHRLYEGDSWIQVTLGLASADFTRQHVRSLRTVMAELAGIDAGEVRVLGVCRWSPAVFFEMPAASAFVLVGSFESIRLSRRFETAQLPVESIAFDLPGRPLDADTGGPWWISALASFEGLLRADRWLALLRGIGLVLAMVLTALPALVFLAIRWVWAKAEPILKKAVGGAIAANLDFYAAALVVPVAFLVLIFCNVIYVQGSVTYVVLLCALVAYLNISAAYHLLTSKIYTKTQVVFQVLWITFLPLVGALVILILLGENDLERFLGPSPDTAGHAEKDRSLWPSLWVSPKFFHRYFRD